MRASGQAIFHSGRLSVLLMALPLVLFLVLTVLPVLLLMPFLMALFGLFMASRASGSGWRTGSASALSVFALN